MNLERQTAKHEGKVAIVSQLWHYKSSLESDRNPYYQTTYVRISQRRGRKLRVLETITGQLFKEGGSTLFTLVPAVND